MIAIGAIEAISFAVLGSHNHWCDKCILLGIFSGSNKSSVIPSFTANMSALSEVERHLLSECSCFVFVSLIFLNIFCFVGKQTKGGKKMEKHKMLPLKTLKGFFERQLPWNYWMDSNFKEVQTIQYDDKNRIYSVQNVSIYQVSCCGHKKKKRII